MADTDKPKFRKTDMRQEVIKADGKKAYYYPVYEFTNKIFIKRDVRGPNL